MAKGDCFEVAAKGLLLTNDYPDGAALVHGTPIGRGARNEGKRYWHAWIEYPLSLAPLGHSDREIWMAADYSNDMEIVTSREHYFQLGKLTEYHCIRYSKTDAAKLITEKGHYGPWVNDADDWVDV